MIGRVVEKRSVANALTAATHDEPTVLTLVGEAGGGKTALLRYAARSARSAPSPFRVVTLRGDEFDAMVPSALKGMVTALRDAIDAVPPPRQRVLNTILGGATDSTCDALTLAVALVDLLAAASAQGPLFMSIDDIHLLDPLSVRALGLTFHRLHTDPILVMLAGRSVPEALFGHGPQLELTGLPVEDCAQMLLHLTPTPPSREVTSELAQQTRGNPLMLADVARLLTPAQLRGTEQLPEPLPIGATGKAIVVPALAPLPVRTHRALTVVALAGPASHLAVPVTLPLLGLQLTDLDPAITGRIVARDGWRFCHPMFAAAVVDNAHPDDVRRTHAALAAVLLGTDVTRHAHHLAAAAGGVDEVAADALDHAAQSAARRGRAAAAAHLWHEAAYRSPPGPARTARLLEAIEAQTAVGHRELAHAGLDELSGATLTQPQLARATRARTALLPWSPAVAQDVMELDAASETIAVSDPAVAVEICINLALAGFSVGAGDLVMRQADRAIAYSAGHPTLVLVSQLLRSFALSIFKGDPWRPEIARLTDPHVRRYLATKLPQMCAGIAQGLIWLEQPEMSTQLRTDVIKTARDTGALADLPYPLAGAGELAWWTGAWGAGRRDIAEAVELAGVVGQGSLLGFAWSLLATYAAAAGQDQDLADALAHADRAAQESGTTPVRIYAARARLHAALAANRIDDAVTHGQNAHAVARTLGLVGLMQVPYLPEYIEAMTLSRSRDAPSLLAELQNRADVARSPWGQSVVARLNAMSSPDRDEARAYFMAALALVPADRMPFEHARTLHRHGERELADGQPPTSRRALSRAIELYVQVGAWAWRDQAAAALRRAGGRATPATQRSNPLSPQQQRVVGLVARGATNREAATRLFLSEKTVEYHVSTAMRSLGATNRTDLTRRYLAQLAREGDQGSNGQS